MYTEQALFLVGISSFLLGLAVGITFGRRRPTRQVVWTEPASSSGALPGTPAAADLDAARPEIEALIRQGQMIEAIKRYREVTDAGLKEAKDAVEAMKRRMG